MVAPWMTQPSDIWNSYLPDAGDYGTAGDYIDALSEGSQDTSPALGGYYNPGTDEWIGGRQTERDYALRQGNFIADNANGPGPGAGLRFESWARNNPDAALQAYHAYDEYGNPLLDPQYLAIIERVLGIEEQAPPPPAHGGGGPGWYGPGGGPDWSQYPGADDGADAHGGGGPGWYGPGGGPDWSQYPGASEEWNPRDKMLPQPIGGNPPPPATPDNPAPPFTGPPAAPPGPPPPPPPPPPSGGGDVPPMPPPSWEENPTQSFGAQATFTQSPIYPDFMLRALGIGRPQGPLRAPMRQQLGGY